MLDFIVIQFAKFPQLGRVKTRLAPDIGHEACLALHYDLLQHTHTMLKEFTQSPSAMTVLFLDQLGQDDVINTIATGTPIMLQQGDDLGDKMANALAWGLTQAKKVCIVGSDCPVLSHDDLIQVLSALDESENVFIAAEDGGYVLVGASKLDITVFRYVPWGSEQVMEVTLKRVAQAQVKAKVLGPLWDVDRFADYQRLLQVIPNWPNQA